MIYQIKETSLKWYIIAQYFPKTLNHRLKEFTELRNIFAHREFLADLERIKNFDGKNILLDAKIATDGKFENAPLTLNQDHTDTMVKEILEINFIIQHLLELVKNAKDDPPIAP